MKELLCEEEKIELLEEDVLNELINFINTNFIMDTSDSSKAKNCKELLKYITKNKIEINDLTADLLLSKCPSLNILANYLSNNPNLVRNNHIATIVSVYENLKDTKTSTGEETEVQGRNLYTKKNGNGDLNLVAMYLDELRFPILTQQEEIELSEKIKQGDSAAFEKLVNHNLRLAVNIAKHYNNRGLPFLDLIQAANEGLLKAAERFDGSKGYKFSTYATWWIKQTIVRSLADTSRNIRIPFNAYEQVNKIRVFINQYQKEHGEEPNNEVISSETGIPLQKIRELSKYLNDTISLSTKIGEENDIELGDFIADESNVEDTITNDLLREKILEVLEDLSEKERHIISLRYGLKDGRCYTLEEVSHVYNVTRERIRQIEAKALRKLRHPSRSKKLASFL